MTKSIIILTLILTLSSCGHFKQRELLVTTPTVGPINNYYKRTYHEAFFNELHFNYADNRQVDSTKYFYTTETTIIEDTSKYFLRNCKAKQHDDSILLQLSDIPFSQSPFELKVTKVGNSLISDLYQTYSIADSSYKPTVFKTISQSVIFDKSQYQKGDSLKGKLAITIAAYHSWDKVYVDTLKIYGLIKTIVD